MLQVDSPAAVGFTYVHIELLPPFAIFPSLAGVAPFSPLPKADEADGTFTGF